MRVKEFEVDSIHALGEKKKTEYERYLDGIYYDTNDDDSYDSDVDFWEKYTKKYPDWVY